MILRSRGCTSGVPQRHHCAETSRSAAPQQQQRAQHCRPLPHQRPLAASGSSIEGFARQRRRRPTDSVVTFAGDGSSSGGGGGGDAAKAAMLARIAAAKQYKTAGGDAAGAAAAASPSAAAPAAAPAQDASEADMAARRAAWEADLRAKEAAARGDGAYSKLMESIEAGTDGSSGDSNDRGQPTRADFYTSRDAPDTATLLANSVRAQAPGRGSATEVAAWMAGVLGADAAPAADALPEGMTMEQFALLREARARAAGADVITAAPGAVIERGVPSTVGGFPAAGAAAADASAAATAGAAAAASTATEAEEAAYRPKVTTWGVFPRPRNVSEAYGGGRDIKPGQALETDAQRAAREAEYAAALQTYKRKAGLAELDPAELAAAEKKYAAAADLMAKGRLSEALAAFDEVRAAVPLKSRLGGNATLQAAICLDSLGDSSAAQTLYRKLRGHPAGDVGRRARHLSFGFEAMDFLKTRSVSYAVGKEEYAKYFRRFADENRVYVPSDEERAADAAASRAAGLIAAGVVLGPVAAFAGFLLLAK